MTSPDSPPPSSSPTTTREAPTAHRDKTGGLDPYPPNPGARLLMLAPHGVLVLELAAVAALARGSVMLLALPALLVVSAWAAWLLARLDARHQPIAIGLGAWAVLALLGRALDVTVLAEPGPHAGWARVAFHVEEAMRLVTAALPALMASAVMCVRRDLVTRSMRMLNWIGCLIVPWLALAIICYPELRGDALRRVYLGAELAGLFVAAVAIVSWARRAWMMRDRLDVDDAEQMRAIVDQRRQAEQHARPRWYTWAPIVWLVAGDALLLLVGAWQFGLFGEAYAVQQAGLLVVWGCVATVQVAALVMARRGR